MKVKKRWIERCAFLLLAVTLPVLRVNTAPGQQAVPAMGQMPDAVTSMAYKESLGNWTHYNGIVFGDASIYDSVSGGGLAVAGNLSVYRDFTIGSTYSALYDATQHIGEYKNEDGYPALLYGGSAIHTGEQVSGLPVHGGSIVMTADSLAQNTQLGNGFVPGTDSSFRQETKEDLDEWFAAQYDLVKNTSTLFAAANDAEISLAEFGSGEYMAKGSDYFNNQYLTYEGEVYENALFITVRTGANVDFGQWWPVQALITFDMNWVLEHDLIVFNFPDAVNVTMNASTFQIVNLSHWSTTVDAWIGESGMRERRALAEKVVYNFPKAGSIEANRALIQGTVLAPRAVFTGTAAGDAGHIYGHIAAREFVADGNFTIHAFSLSRWAFDIVEDAIDDMKTTADIVLRQYLYFDREPTPIRVEGGAYMLADTNGNFYDGAGGFTSLEHAMEYAVEGLEDLVIADIPLGQYMLIHTKAPPGFIVNTENADNPYTAAAYPVILSRMDERVHILRYIEPAFTALTFRKTDPDTGMGLAGAAFAAIRLGDAYEETTIGGRFYSDEDGFFTMHGLPIGDYRLVELQAPPGYSLTEGGDFYFTVFWNEEQARLEAMDSEGNVFLGTLEEPVILHNVQSAGERTLMVIKYAAEQEDDDTVATLPGAVFSLYRYEAETGLWEQVTEQAAQEESDDETQAEPPPDAPDEDPAEADAEETEEDPAEEPAPEEEAPEEIPPDEAEQIQQTLLGEPPEDAGEGMEEEAEPDAAQEEPETAQEAPPEAAQPLRIVTNALGYCRVFALEAGEYRLVEEEAPAGYGRNNPHQDADFAEGYAHAFTMQEEDSLHTIYSEGTAVTASLTIHTVGSLLESQVNLPGAVYTLARRLQDGSTWEEIAYGAAADADGRVVIEELAAGFYRLTQTATSAGYSILPNGEITFSLDFDSMNNPLVSANYNGNTVSGQTAPVSLSEDGAPAFRIYNEAKTHPFTVYKTSDDYKTGTDESGRPFYEVTYLEGATFRLQRRADTRDIWRDYGGAFTSTLVYDGGAPVLDGYGNHIAAAVFDGGLLYGEYHLIETTVPDGHTANSNITVTLEDGTTGALVHSFLVVEGIRNAAERITYTAENREIVQTAAWGFTKVDFMQPEIPLAGAVFDLYYCPLEHTHDSLAAESSCWRAAQSRRAVSNQAGQVQFEGLETGAYLLHEASAPVSYRLPQGVWLLAVDADAGSTAVSAPDSAAVPAFSELNGALLLPNEKQIVLPLTGSRAKPALLAGGALCIILAAYIAARNKRKG